MTFLFYIYISDFQSHLDRRKTKNNEMTHTYSNLDQPGHLCPIKSQKVKKSKLQHYDSQVTSLISLSCPHQETLDP